VSVFQDLAYQLENADLRSGFITASSPTKNKTSFLEALTDQRGSGNSKVTAFVEQMPNGMARQAQLCKQQNHLRFVRPIRKE
jgi:hypothetical protein